MDTTAIQLTVLLVLAVLNLVALLVFFFRPSKDSASAETREKVMLFSSNLSSFQDTLRTDLKLGRDENAQQGLSNRTELGNSLGQFRTEVTDALKRIGDENSAALEKINATLTERATALVKATDDSGAANRDELGKKVKELTEQSRADATDMRLAMGKSLKDFQDAFDRGVISINDLQKEKLGQLTAKQAELITSTENKLEEMRKTVDEKLEKTLSERLGQSFKIVGDQLENVQKGLGEMQTIAQDVGGLKKVLSNVKLRGGIGEVQLSFLLEQIMAPDQYAANVRTKEGSSDIVEFAIKLPGKDDHGTVMYLPIDAKFPKDVYEQLQDAHDSGDQTRIDGAMRAFEDRLKLEAKKISEKYIDPPNTTDFAIMFLPFEGIYAEAVRKSSLLETMQRSYKVIVAGPSTLAALLNSLQMGFKSLAIQRRASEVWQVLGAVKTEFDKFGGLLDKAKKNVEAAGTTLDSLIGTRTNVIKRKLRDIEALPAAESVQLLPEAAVEGSAEDEEEVI